MWIALAPPHVRFGGAEVTSVAEREEGAKGRAGVEDCAAAAGEKREGGGRSSEREREREWHLRPG